MNAKRPPLLQGKDPAEAIFREQVKRDVEAAHRYLQKLKEKQPC